MIKKVIPFLFLIFITFAFFWQFFFKGLIPIPSDTIVGLYHPYRDFYEKDYPNGIPFKNFLITDPVRQQYPWKNISIDNLKKGSLPTWNKYSFSGTPLLANYQSGVFYPINIAFFVLPFIYSWTLLIILQVFLASIFMYLYLRNLKLDEYSSIFGSIVFAFGGFFSTWLEWGTVLQTALWLPLIILSIDKISGFINNKRYLFIWSTILIFSVISSVFAGHPQTFLYLLVISILYSIARFLQKRDKKYGLVLLISLITSLIISAIQILPSIEFIKLSARNLDQLIWQKEGWFLPWEHLVQFLIPDFFGNPSTLNYFGTWNYGELTAYVGVITLIIAAYALFFRRDKKTLFFGTLLFAALFLSLPTIFAKLPFILNIPFLSTAQPTRLIFVIDFSLAVLSALGLNYLLKSKNKKEIFAPLIIIVLLFGIVLLVVLGGERLGVDPINLAVAKRNMILPLITLALSFVLITLLIKVNKKLVPFVLILILGLIIFDLFRFSWKFNTFSKAEYLYPRTASIEFLQKNIGEYRIATNDPRILAPNFSIMHGISSVEGYDPIYLLRYGELVASINRNKPDISPPFGFNRIVRVENFDTNLINLLGVKYVLSLNEMDVEGFEEVYSEGKTLIYENKNVLPKAFFVEEVVRSDDKNQTIVQMFGSEFDPAKTAVVESGIDSAKFEKGKVRSLDYTDNKVIIKTNNVSDGFLVLTDSFYPTWKVTINGKISEIYLTDYNFRGIYVPAGNNEIIFYNSLL